MSTQSRFNLGEFSIIGVVLPKEGMLAVLVNRLFLGMAKALNQIWKK